MVPSFRSSGRMLLLAGTILACMFLGSVVNYNTTSTDRLSGVVRVEPQVNIDRKVPTSKPEPPKHLVLEPREPIPIYNPKQVVYLLHILKTGGTTLSDMFELMFDPSQIVPESNRSDSMSREYFIQLKSMKVPDPNWVIGYGHESFKLVNVLGFPVQGITILRDPTTHLRSVWKSPVFDECKVGVSSFAEWIASDIFETCAYIQSSTLSDYGTHYPVPKNKEWTPSPQDATDQSKRNLRKMPWFGLTDRWVESICLMYYTFGWHPLPLDKVEAQRARNDTEEFDAATMRLLREHAWVDYALYDLAVDIHEKRIRQMQYEVINNAAPPGRPKITKWLPECLALAQGRL